MPKHYSTQWAHGSDAAAGRFRRIPPFNPTGGRGAFSPGRRHESLVVPPGAHGHHGAFRSWPWQKLGPANWRTSSWTDPNQERRMMQLTRPDDVVSLSHIAIIMDGNGRWAKARGLPRAAGHRKGAEAVRRTVEAAIEQGIPYLTLFSFSSENWKRPASEVEDLMSLLRRYLQGEIAELHKQSIRLRVIGERDRLPADVVGLIEEGELRTQSNDRLVLTMAISYGGRQELAAAARDLAVAAASGEIVADEIGESALAARLMTFGLPDPDLLIRTSGEQRISNFMLWQCAYSELVFTDKLWPEFGAEDLAGAIEEFRRRERRFGAAAGSG